MHGAERLLVARLEEWWAQARVLYIFVNEVERATWLEDVWGGVVEAMALYEIASKVEDLLADWLEGGADLDRKEPTRETAGEAADLLAGRVEEDLAREVTASREPCSDEEAR